MIFTYKTFKLNANTYRVAIYHTAFMDQPLLTMDKIDDCDPVYDWNMHECSHEEQRMINDYVSSIKHKIENLRTLYR